MNKEKIIAKIDEEISELGSRKGLSGIRFDNVYGFLTPDNIDTKIKWRKWGYYFLLVFSILYIIAISIVLGKDLLYLKTIEFSKGLLFLSTLLLCITSLVRIKRDWEKLKMIKYLFDLKATVEEVK